MKTNDVSRPEILPIFDYYIYHNLINSMLLRKMGKLERFAGNNAAVLCWGPSVFTGGDFSDEAGEKLVSALKEADSPRYIYSPEGEWSALIEDAFLGRLKEIYLNVYKAADADAASADESIVRVTRAFMEKALPGTELLTDELYSYTDMEDFYRNGFGFALVIDGRVCGYCLSEYSVDSSHGINIWVAEQYRRMGYAGRMTNAFLQLCRERSEKAYWVCNDDNIPSNKTAVSAGFALEATMRYFEL